MGDPDPNGIPTCHQLYFKFHVIGLVFGCHPGTNPDSMTTDDLPDSGIEPRSVVAAITTPTKHYIFFKFNLNLF